MNYNRLKKSAYHIRKANLRRHWATQSFCGIPTIVESGIIILRWKNMRLRKIVTWAYGWNHREARYYNYKKIILQCEQWWVCIDEDGTRGWRSYQNYMVKDKHEWGTKKHPKSTSAIIPKYHQVLLLLQIYFFIIKKS
jgi:hypothetical protein